MKDWRKARKNMTSLTEQEKRDIDMGVEISATLHSIKTKENGHIINYLLKKLEEYVTKV